MLDDHFRDTVKRITEILKDEKIPYHITGGLAASFYGEPRFTQDLDIVLRLSSTIDPRALLDALAKQFVVDIASAELAIKTGKMFQALDEKTIIKIELYPNEKIPGEIDRSKTRELLPGVSVSMVSKEDAILSKLLWVKGGSEKAKRDVRAMLFQTDDVNMERLRHMAKEIGVEDELAESFAD